jgi:hypothetical protein
MHTGHQAPSQDRPTPRPLASRVVVAVLLLATYLAALVATSGGATAGLPPWALVCPCERCLGIGIGLLLAAGIALARPTGPLLGIGLVLPLVVEKLSWASGAAALQPSARFLVGAAFGAGCMILAAGTGSPASGGRRA